MCGNINASMVENNAVLSKYTLKQLYLTLFIIPDLISSLSDPWALIDNYLHNQHRIVLELETRTAEETL